MARRATRAGIGIAVVVTIVLNAVVVAARTGGGHTPVVDPGSARSASLGAGPLEAEEAARTATTVAPTTETSTAGGSVDRPTTTAGRRGPVSTVTTRLPAATSTTVTPSPGGLDGPGLYVVAPDGTGVRKLGSRNGMFSWSPDGTRLAYNSGEELIVVRVDGSGQTTLPAGRGALAPHWSPDGSRIAFSRDGGTYVVRSDGSGPATLVDASARLSAWTRDGRLIVITSVERGLSDVVLYDLAGRRTVLASDALTIVQPATSPDGRLVAYMSNRILVAGVDGSGSRPLTDPCCGSESVASPLRWSPDGRRVAFIHFGDVRVVGVDGTGERVLVPKATAPAWSPDGQRLAVIDESAKRPDGLLHLTLRTVNASGGERRTVLDAGDMSVHTPQWSPTGRLIAVNVGRVGPAGGPVLP
jgi:Tol biopolymer transport system component